MLLILSLSSPVISVLACPPLVLVSAPKLMPQLSVFVPDSPSSVIPVLACPSPVVSVDAPVSSPPASVHVDQDEEVPPPPSTCEVHVGPSAPDCRECVPGLLVCDAHIEACGGVALICCSFCFLCFKHSIAHALTQRNVDAWSPARFGSQNSSKSHLASLLLNCSMLEAMFLRVLFAG